MVAPGPVSWLGLRCRGGLCTAVLYSTTSHQAPLATTNSHQRTHGCYLGLRRPDRADRADSTTITTISDMIRNISSSEILNIEMQTYPLTVLQPLFSVSIQFVFWSLFPSLPTTTVYNLDGTLNLSNYIK